MGHICPTLVLLDQSMLFKIFPVSLINNLSKNLSASHEYSTKNKHANVDLIILQFLFQIRIVSVVICGSYLILFSGVRNMVENIILY